MNDNEPYNQAYQNLPNQNQPQNNQQNQPQYQNNYQPQNQDYNQQHNENWYNQQQQPQEQQPNQANFYVGQPHQNYDIDHQQYIDNNNPLIGGNQSKELLLAGFSERKGFIVKVYSLLSLQLLMTFGLTLASYLSQPFRNFLVNPQNGNLSAFSWVCFAVMFVTEIALLCCKSVARKVPNNYILLTVFTFGMSVLVAAICGTVYNFYDSDGGFIVLAAALLTLGVTLALTAYACTTKTDITMMGGALWIISMVLLMVLIISFFNQSVILQLIISALVIVCYGFYLIYDTQLIMGGKQHELSIDDYIIATMIIYIDIIVLFLRILQILVILFGGKK